LLSRTCPGTRSCARRSRLPLQLNRSQPLFLPSLPPLHKQGPPSWHPAPPELRLAAQQAAALAQSEGAPLPGLALAFSLGCVSSEGVAVGACVGLSVCRQLLALAFPPTLSGPLGTSPGATCTHSFALLFAATNPDVRYDAHFRYKLSSRSCVLLLHIEVIWCKSRNFPTTTTTLSKAPCMPCWLQGATHSNNAGGHGVGCPGEHVRLLASMHRES
jgi:hypothetical protein